MVSIRRDSLHILISNRVLQCNKLQETANVTPCLIQSFSVAAVTLALEPNTIPDSAFAQQAHKQNGHTSLGNGKQMFNATTMLPSNYQVQPQMNLWLSAGSYHQKLEFKWHEEYDLPVGFRRPGAEQSLPIRNK